MSITDPGYSPDRYAPKPPEEQVDIPQDGQPIAADVVVSAMAD